MLLYYAIEGNISQLTDKNISYWRAVLEMNNGNQLIPVSKIFMHVVNGEFDIARRYLQIITPFCDESSLATYYLSELNWRIADFYEDHDKQVQMGIKLHDEQQYQKAIEEYKKALDLDPNYGEVMNNLAYAYSDLGNFAKAIEYFEKYASIFPEDANPHDSMGEVYARTILGIEDPTLGLLNVGAEDTKGNESLRAAADIIRGLNFPGEFVGFVEGDDIPTGAVDVVVTDGFTGNIALKTAEGTAKLINGFVREAFRSSIWAKIGYVFAKHSLDKLRSRSDPRRYNGAMFLGLNGICVKSHGGTDAVGFATAIGVALDMIEYGGNQLIAEQIARLDLSEAGGTL